jgi:Mannosyltransferase (PIG-V)
VLDHEEEVRSTSGIGFVLAVFALSRAFYLVVGLVLAKVVPVGGLQRLTSDMPSGRMNLWSHWDGEHYVALALDGYLHPPSNVSPAFFPLYPLLMRGVSELLGGPDSKGAMSLCGLLVSLLVLPFAFYFLYQIALQGWGRTVARGSVLAFAFFPTAFFLNATYTESLFLALSTGALWAIRVRRNLLLACLLAGLASATRNVGVFLAIPLALEWVRAGGLQERRGRWHVVYLALAPSGLIAYMGYLWTKFGDPLRFYSAQRDWGREPTGPATTAIRTWDVAEQGAVILRDPQLWTQPSLGRLADRISAAHGLYDLALLALTVVVLLAGLRKLPLSLVLYGFLLVLPATLFGTPETPLMGAPRYLLAAFPLFIGLGLLTRWRLVFGLWLVLSAAMSIVLCGLFVTWWYVA